MRRSSFPLYALFAVALCLTCFPALGASGPKMVLKESSHDAKDVKEGVVIQHTLSVFNDGDQPLLVQDVNSD